jgi:hypothetical protein
LPGRLLSLLATGLLRYARNDGLAGRLASPKSTPLLIAHSSLLIRLSVATFCDVCHFFVKN